MQTVGTGFSPRPQRRRRRRDAAGEDLVRRRGRRQQPQRLLRHAAAIAERWVPLQGGIAAGLAASAKFPTQRHIFHSAANVAGLSLIALGLVSTSGSRDGLFSQPWTFFAGVAAPCVVGIACSFALSTAAGLTKPQVTAVGIETVYQNTALALSVALASPAMGRMLRRLPEPIAKGEADAPFPMASGARRQMGPAHPKL